ncbi:MAG: hypothetical protein FWC39_06980 [Bacteroidetes bacterium]|nr:hypothetical protein [Bacteroidota bacterium]
MNKINKAVIYLLGFVLFYNCATHTKLINTEPKNISTFSVENFNGNYCNKNKERVSDSAYSSLWDNLCENRIFGKRKVSYTDLSVVSLKFESNKLIVNLIENENIVATKILKGKVKDNYVSIRKIRRFIPIPFFLWYNSNKIILGNLDNGDLVLKDKYNSFGWFLFFADGSDGIFSAGYEKLNLREDNNE